MHPALPPSSLSLSNQACAPSPASLDTSSSPLRSLGVAKRHWEGFCQSIYVFCIEKTCQKIEGCLESQKLLCGFWTVHYCGKKLNVVARVECRGKRIILDRILTLKLSDHLRGNAKRDTLSHTTFAPLHTEVRHSRECVANDHFHSWSTADQIPVI